MAENSHPIPTQVINYWREDNLAGLVAYYTALDRNVVSISTNIHTVETSGVADSAITIYNKACDAIWPLNQFCKSATIKWGAVYRGRIIGGVNDIPTPQFTLKGDWTENLSRRTATETQIDIYGESTVVITYNFAMCVTAVEEKTPTLVHTGEERPDDTSYYILLQDDPLIGDIGSWEYDLDVNEEGLRIDAYKKAKTMALLPEKVTTLYSFIRADMAPGGEFYKRLTAIYTPEVATLFHVKGFEFVINIAEGDPLLRCDGTPINK